MSAETPEQKLLRECLEELVAALARMRTPDSSDSIVQPTVKPGAPLRLKDLDDEPPAGRALIYTHDNGLDWALVDLKKVTAAENAPKTTPAPVVKPTPTRQRLSRSVYRLVTEILDLGAARLSTEQQKLDMGATLAEIINVQCDEGDPVTGETIRHKTQQTLTTVLLSLSDEEAERLAKTLRDQVASFQPPPAEQDDLAKLADKLGGQSTDSPAPPPKPTPAPRRQYLSRPVQRLVTEILDLGKALPSTSKKKRAAGALAARINQDRGKDDQVRAQDIRENTADVLTQILLDLSNRQALALATSMRDIMRPIRHTFWKATVGQMPTLAQKVKNGQADRGMVETALHTEAGYRQTLDEHDPDNKIPSHAKLRAYEDAWELLNAEPGEKVPSRPRRRRQRQPRRTPHH